MGEPLHLLLVEDQEDDALLIVRALRRGGFDVSFERVETAAAMEAALAAQAWDVVIADHAMPQFDGLAALSLLQETELDMPFILVSGTIGEEVAVTAMRAGAHDYVMKHNLARLVPAVQRELVEVETRVSRRRARQLLGVLNQVALEMENALTSEGIFDAFAHELEKVGLSCILLPVDQNQGRLLTKHISLDSMLVRAAEKLAGLGHHDYSFAIDDVDVYQQVVSERKTVLIHDTEAVMRQVLPGPFKRLSAQIVRMVGYNAAIAAPLIVADKVIGVLSIQATDLTEDDVPAVTAFANQVATAWRKAELFERAQQEIAERRRAEEALWHRTAQLEALQQVGLELTAQLDLDKLLQFIVSQAIELLGAQSGGMYLYRPDLQLLEWSIAIGPHLPPMGSTLAAGDGLCGQVWDTGEPLIVNDYRAWDGKSASFDGLANVATVGALVHWGTESLGVLNVTTEVPHTFATADAEFLESFATQAAIAIRNARLYEAAENRAERLAVVNHIARAVGAALHLDHLLETVYQEVTTIFQADAFFIALYDEQDDELEFRFQVDGGVRQPPERQPRNEGLTSLVVTEKRALLVQDFEREQHSLPMPTPWGSMKVAASWLGVPMQIGERLVGIICVQSYQPYAYAHEDQLLLSTIADQVTVAVERARLYHTLRERRRYLEGVLAAAPDAIVTQDADGRIVEWNPGAEKLFGFSSAEAMGQPLDQLLNSEDTIEEAAALSQAAAVGSPVLPRESIRYNKSGVPVDVILAGSPILHEDELIGVVAAYTDISERKRAERLLRALNEVSLPMERSLTPEDIFVTVGEGFKRLGFSSAILLIMEDASRLYPKYFSYEAKAVALAKRLLNVKAETFSIQVESVDAFRAVIEDGRTILVDGKQVMEQVLPKSLRGLAGRAVELLDVERTICAPLTVDDEIIGLLSVQSADLTEDDLPAITAFAHQMAAAWRKAQLMQDLETSLKELHQTQSQLFQAQKMEALGRMAGGIAHDFNNLLTVIDISTRLLERQMHPEDPLWENVSRIRETSERAAKLTTQLLRFSRRENIEPRVVNLNALIGDLGGLLRRIIGEDVQMNTELAKDLRSVEVDPTQMEQVLINLAVNARDAMPQGGELSIKTTNIVLDEVYVTQRMEAKDGEHVVLSISDTGTGMTDRVKQRLFEPFFTTKGRGRGTGLGLPIVFGIVKQSGGHIGVYSELGLGTTFRIYLPTTQQVDEQVPREHVALSSASGTETILLVEDDAAVRELAATILSEHGYHVLSAPDGPSALQTSEECGTRIDLLLTDVVMPQMNGKQLAEHLQAQWNSLRVLYMSGYSSDVIAYHGVLDEGVVILQKPFTLDSLTREVRAVLDL